MPGADFSLTICAKRNQISTQHMPRACLSCKRSHVSCDEGDLLTILFIDWLKMIVSRPCSRCVRLNKDCAEAPTGEKKRKSVQSDESRPYPYLPSPLIVLDHQPFGSPIGDVVILFSSLIVSLVVRHSSIAAERNYFFQQYVEQRADGISIQS